jgi:putative ABC transport system ATP-binding protein
MGDLSIQNLTVEYASGADTVRPIDGLNLDVAAGSLVILMGPSGCGKTTLLSCLGGILRPSAGAISGDYFGEIGPVFHMPRSATVRARTDAKVVGYTVRAFRERLGLGGVRDLIEHRRLELDEQTD